MAGGTINSTYLLNGPPAPLVLKEYSGLQITGDRLAFLCQAQALAADRGLPVPKLLPGRDGRPFVEAGGTFFCLSEYVVGHVYERGSMPDEAARRMGTMLWKLHEVLAELPDHGEGPSWAAPDRTSFEDRLNQLLDLVAARRPAGPIDVLARIVLEQKLRTPEVPLPPNEPCQWLHGDYTWRNVLVNEHDEVAAVIDFDNMRFLPRSYDVMRAFALGFDASTTAAESFFSGYAQSAGLTPDDVGTYVSSWRYTSSFRLWPLDVRYLDPTHYHPAWDEGIPSLAPASPEQWESLADRLTSLVTSPRGVGTK